MGNKEIGIEIINKVIQENEGILAAGIFGSSGTLREEPYSDLELIFITSEKHVDKFGIEKKTNGIPYKQCLFYRTKQEIRDRISNINHNWTEEVTPFFEAIPVYDNHKIFEENKKYLEEMPLYDFKKASKKLISHAFEYVGKMHNDIKNGNHIRLLMSGKALAELLTKSVALSKKKYFIDSTNKFVEACGWGDLPENFEKDLFKAAGLTTLNPSVAYVSALNLWKNILKYHEIPGEEYE